MVTMLRLPFALLLLFAVLMLVGVIQVTKAASRGWQELDLLALRLLVEGPQRETAIRNWEAIIQRRVRGKQQIAHDLLEGRLTLWEAAARFRQLEEQTSEYIGYPRNLRPGETIEENLCRQVIRWACNEAPVSSSCEQDQLAQRWEAELEEHLRQEGKIQLPWE